MLNIHDSLTTAPFYRASYGTPDNIAVFLPHIVSERRWNNIAFTGGRVTSATPSSPVCYVDMVQGACLLLRRLKSVSHLVRVIRSCGIVVEADRRLCRIYDTISKVSQRYLKGWETRPGAHLGFLLGIQYGGTSRRGDRTTARRGLGIYPRKCARSEGL